MSAGAPTTSTRVSDCGHGHFDMKAYQQYFAGELADYEYPAEKVAEAMEHVPVVAG